MSKLRLTKDHRYKLGNIDFTSVTTFLSKFFGKFDERAVARKLANINKYNYNRTGDIRYKEKSTVKYWRSLWKEDRTHGTRVHNAIEKFLTTGEVSEMSVRDFNKFNQFRRFFVEFKETCGDIVSVKCEVQLYNEKLKLAGTIDCLIMHSDGSYTILDWKTNKEIKTTSKEFCLAPISHLQDCNYNKYKLQLAVYGKMIEMDGMVVKRRAIVHLTEDNYTYYNVEAMREDMELMFNE